jgi:thioredoxin reductase
MTKFDVVVVGAGPAGLSAACTAAEAGMTVALIDDQKRIGGQYYRHASVDRVAPIFAPRFGRASFVKSAETSLRENRATILSDATVIDFSAENILTVSSAGHLNSIQGSSVVLATGARERIIPFPGWTTPGVIGAGAVQNMMKSSGVIPGSRVLVMGTSPLCLLAANSLIRCGAKVVAVCGPRRPPISVGLLKRLILRPDILSRGVGYLALLKLARVPMLHDHGVTEINGRDRVTEVVLRQAGDDSPNEKRLAVDLVVVNDGLIPNIELASRAGCEIEWQQSNLAWAPKRDENFETTVRGVFVVGDCVTTSGVENSRLEGKMVANFIAASRVKHDRHRRELLGLRRKWARLQAFRSAIIALSTADSLQQREVPDDILICRCEDVTLGAIKQMIGLGVSDLDSLKAETRVCMGRCQGRTCMHTVLNLLEGHSPASPGRLKPPVPRLPVKPVRVGDAMGGELP